MLRLRTDRSAQLLSGAAGNHTCVSLSKAHVLKSPNQTTTSDAPQASGGSESFTYLGRAQGPDDVHQPSLILWGHTVDAVRGHHKGEPLGQGGGCLQCAALGAKVSGDFTSDAAQHSRAYHSVSCQDGASGSMGLISPFHSWKTKAWQVAQVNWNPRLLLSQAVLFLPPSHQSHCCPVLVLLSAVCPYAISLCLLPLPHLPVYVV